MDREQLEECAKILKILVKPEMDDEDIENKIKRKALKGTKYISARTDGEKLKDYFERIKEEQTVYHEFRQIAKELSLDAIEDETIVQNLQRAKRIKERSIKVDKLGWLINYAQTPANSREYAFTISSRRDEEFDAKKLHTMIKNIYFTLTKSSFIGKLCEFKIYDSGICLIKGRNHQTLEELEELLAGGTVQLNGLTLFVWTFNSFTRK